MTHIRDSRISTYMNKTYVYENDIRIAEVILLPVPKVYRASSDISSSIRPWYTHNVTQCVTQSGIPAHVTNHNGVIFVQQGRFIPISSTVLDIDVDTYITSLVGARTNTYEVNELLAWYEAPRSRQLQVNEHYRWWRAKNPNFGIEVSTIKQVALPLIAHRDIEQVYETTGGYLALSLVDGLIIQGDTKLRRKSFMAVSLRSTQEP